MRPIQPKKSSYNIILHSFYKIYVKYPIETVGLLIEPLSNYQIHNFVTSSSHVYSGLNLK